MVLFFCPGKYEKKKNVTLSLDGEGGNAKTPSCTENEKGHSDTQCCMHKLGGSGMKKRGGGGGVATTHRCILRCLTQLGSEAVSAVLRCYDAIDRIVRGLSLSL